MLTQRCRATPAVFVALVARLREVSYSKLFKLPEMLKDKNGFIDFEYPEPRDLALVLQREYDLNVENLVNSGIYPTAERETARLNNKRLVSREVHIAHNTNSHSSMRADQHT